MDITEIQDELLRLEYPNLLPDHDPDIERYYYLRSMGHSREAMALFQNRLVPRYPDHEFRTWLLRSYRSHDPAFRSLLARGYRMLGARSLERIKQIILIIAERAESFNEKDVYSTIKAAEEILQFLPQERYEAVAGIERFLRYASVLNLKEKSILRAAELVRAYLTDTLSVVEEERRRRSEVVRKAEEKERQRLVKADWENYEFQKKYGHRIPLIDLSAVNFSPADLARIEIPVFNRIEDQVLAYCIKYWNVSNDPAFERILFLYSRKYGKKNYDVYMAMRRGKMAKHRDDEILASIMSLLVTGYYYSIQGDIYLQRNWNAIKHSLQNQIVQQNRLALPPPETKPVVEEPAKQSAAARPEKPAAKPAVKKPAAAKPAAKSTAKKPVAKPAARTKSAAAKPAVKRPAAANPTAKPAAKKSVAKPAVRTKSTAAKPAAKQSAAKLVPMPRPKTAPKIAPAKKKPVSRMAVVVRPVRQMPPVQPKSAVQPPVPVSRPAEVKVPPKLKPAEGQRTIIVAPKPAPVKPAIPVKPAAKPPVHSGPAPFVPSSPPPRPRKQKMIVSTKLEKARGSVSDRLKELSGRSYDVYQDRFLAKSRGAIRKVLGAGRGLFFNLPEEAEDLVHNFLRNHYSDPYMNWELSTERSALAVMGFDLPSLYPIIDECYHTL